MTTRTDKRHGVRVKVKLSPDSRNRTIRASSKAEKHLAKLGKSTKDSIKAELALLSAYEKPLQHPDAKPLLGPLKGINRLRVGKYRVIFSILEKERIIAVVNNASRADAKK
jgi:mRNA-degrading endonuclease RelE of RelBE toxin-antitoxin system